MDAPTPEELQTWHRRMAVITNNRTWALAEQASRTDAEDGEMLHGAHASLYHWSQVGTTQNVARARMLLGHVQALLGQGELALENARAAFEFVMQEGAEPWEQAFAHAILANAAAAAGLQELHQQHYGQAEVIGTGLEIPEEREIFMATFTVIPAPRG
ncbi:MAG: hypothetical protein RLZZ385_1860 [Pseudomonadota bacterium]|jgi:hypothetical protein